MTLEVLTKRIKTTTDLRDIVSTMKMLSSVSVGPYEKALQSLESYEDVVKSAFQGLLQDDRFTYTRPRLKNQTPKTIAIVIGTDNGLVGGFNREILTFAQTDLRDKKVLSSAKILCVGKRIGMMAKSKKMSVITTYPIMNSLKEIAEISAQVLMTAHTTLIQEKAEQILIYYMHKNAKVKPTMAPLFPLPDMTSLKKEKWTGKTKPMMTGDRQALFGALIHEYLEVMIIGALTASLAAEHYTRMLNMQQAEKNIDESLSVMNLEYQQLRQTNITDELIDIVSGAESMKKKR